MCIKQMEVFHDDEIRNEHDLTGDHQGGEVDEKDGITPWKSEASKGVCCHCRGNECSQAGESRHLYRVEQESQKRNNPEHLDVVDQQKIIGQKHKRF